MSTPSVIDERARGPRIHRIAPDHPLAAAVLVELAIEYSTRYTASAGAIHRRMSDRPATDFAAPDGGLVVLVENGEPVASGSFRRVDATTAELKRFWTVRDQRRRGLATRVLAELEAGMVRFGYLRAIAVTGDGQPEARGLYPAAGYDEVSAAGRRYSFEKVLDIATRPSRARRFAAADIGRRASSGVTTARYRPVRDSSAK
ncbi:GNAT family N-acetyltransferase [Nocardia carnea]|uniref:GNAT family N-acetyltransferase n=1 Tax=Nocardia carnea TaxID=37328 RepID=UPI0024538895|nr:GNAT family N-acetyltransferase [Nocardia carnea]